MKLKDKVAIVTGSSRGIGKAIALAMGEEGASVVVVARTETEEGPLPGTIYQTAKEINNLGGKALPLRTDITKEEDIENMVTKTLQEFGRIDILVNNAGIFYGGTLMETSPRRWETIMNINLGSVFLCTRMALPYMLKQNCGSIINVSSFVVRDLEFEGISIVYAVSKVGIERLTLGLAKELKDTDIAVNAIVPGHVFTEAAKILRPDADPSTLQSPRMWGKYAVLIAAQEPKGFTGRILAKEDLEKEFGPV